jgi:AraC-like DNA-binding protein
MALQNKLPGDQSCYFDRQLNQLKLQTLSVFRYNKAIDTGYIAGMKINKPGKPGGDNWHIDPDALEAYYALSGIQPLSEEGAVRVQPTFGDAEGFREIIMLEDGFQVVLGDITCHKEAYLSMKSDTSLKFHYRLEGLSGLELSDELENRIANYSMGVLLHPEGLEKHEHYLAGEHERSVTLICESQFLRNLFSGITDKLPEALADYVLNDEATAYRDSLPMKTDMVSAANMILTNELQGAMRRYYIEGRALELLVLSLQACIDAVANADNPERGMSQREVERMHKTRQLLEQQYVNPPTISELARHIGLNEAKLMHDFKQLFGQTIFDFTQNLRMDEAKRLLETTERSITEIAFDVGYEYSSNFTTAFKRRFGITPSVAREAFRR